MPEEKKAPEVAVKYVFHVCNDVAAVRRFYVELLGMKEASYQEGIWLSVNAGGFHFMWFAADEEQPVPTEFMCQPGWPGGTIEATSWAVGMGEARFGEVHERLREAGTTLFKPDPEWRQDSYWGLSALDPMGVTVEVFTVPEERPASTTWPGE